MNLIGIVRVSTEEQAGETGEGLARQRDSIQKIAAGLGANLTLVEICGVSGSDLADTPEWSEQILPSIRAGAHVAADAIDRIVRADAFDLRTLATLQATGTRVYLPGRVYDPTDPRDGLTLNLFASIGGYEKKELVRRAQAGKEAKRRNGEWVSRLDALPLGLTYSRETKRWGYNDRADDVRAAFQSVAEGMSLGKIAERLGLTRSGARVMLSNPLYKGMLVYDEKRGEKYKSKGGRQADRKRVKRLPEEVIEVRVYGDEGQADQLVPDTLWRDVQNRIHQVATAFKRQRAKSRPETPFSGHLASYIEPVPMDAGEAIPLTFAGNDARPHTLYGKRAHGKNYYICRCKNSNSDPHAPKHKCGLGYLKTDYATPGVAEYLRRLTNQPEALAAVKATVRDSSNGNGAERARLERLLKDIDRKEERLEDLYLDGRISRDRHAAKQDKLRIARKDAMEAMDEVDTPVVTEADIDRMASDWTFNPEWDHETVREWCSKYIAQILVSNHGVEAVLVRIPGHPAPVYVCGEPTSWFDLTGIKPLHRKRSSK